MIASFNESLSTEESFSATIFMAESDKNFRNALFFLFDAIKQGVENLLYLIIKRVGLRDHATTGKVFLAR
jgi:hypothetical protein